MDEGTNEGTRIQGLKDAGSRKVTGLVQNLSLQDFMPVSMLRPVTTTLGELDADNDLLVGSMAKTLSPAWSCAWWHGTQAHYEGWRSASSPGPGQVLFLEARFLDERIGSCKGWTTGDWLLSGGPGRSARHSPRLAGASYYLQLQPFKQKRPLVVLCMILVGQEKLMTVKVSRMGQKSVEYASTSPSFEER